VRAERPQPGQAVAENDDLGPGLVDVEEGGDQDPARLAIAVLMASLCVASLLAARLALVAGASHAPD
jgi:hypothetical protein